MLSGVSAPRFLIFSGDRSGMKGVIKRTIGCYFRGFDFYCGQMVFWYDGFIFFKHVKNAQKRADGKNCGQENVFHGRKSRSIDRDISF